MLPRAQRLTTREFAVVFDNARVLRHPLLQLRCYRRAEQKLKSPKRETCAAFVAPKKLGNAVVRNAIRRRVRERYRILRAEAMQLQPWNAALENCDLVFLTTAQCAAATSEQIDESLIALLKRAARN